MRQYSESKLAGGALREAPSLAVDALAAPIARENALVALAALGLSRDPVHEPVHAPRPCVLAMLLLCVTLSTMIWIRPASRGRRGPPLDPYAATQIVRLGRRPDLPYE
jgi:hypothetical protein